MPRFPVSVELFIPFSLLPMEAKNLPNLASAVKHASALAVEKWQDYARGKPLPDGSSIRHLTGTYLKSIQVRNTGAFAAEAYSDLPYAQSIEEGMPARDLKKMLNTSLKVRMSKKGKRYLIIPFRWGAYNPQGKESGITSTGMPMMPESIHQFVSNNAFSASRIRGVKNRVSGTGAWDVKTRSPVTIVERKYHWGSRLTGDQISGKEIFGTAAKRMAGMVKFQNLTRGGSMDTQYLTFRVMVEGSPGWMAKAISGKHPARAVADEMRPLAKLVFEEALKRDCETAMNRS